MIRRALLALALVALAGCAALRVAETPKQRLYAAMNVYAITLDLAAAYANSPHPEPAIVEAMASVDRRAQDVLQFAHAALAADNQERVTIAADVLEALAEELRGLVEQAKEPPASPLAWSAT